MVSSSPSPSRSLHQHRNADGDEDQGPESSEPIEVPPAELIEQKDYAQSDQDDRSDRNARTRTLLNRRWLPFNRNRRRCASWCSRGGPAGVPEEVHVVEAEWIWGRDTHLLRLR